MKFLLIPACALALASCSTLPNPSDLPAASAQLEEAPELLRFSAKAHGQRWSRYDRVDVDYHGEWSRIATRIQPVLTDSGFRKSSSESYFPSTGQVLQAHRGPEGRKDVERTDQRIRVRYNDVPENDPDQLAASALVADAHTAFLFGPSWLLEKGADFHLLKPRNLDGKSCELVSGSLQPGFGRSEEDRFIAWIDRETGLMRRLQITLEGMESTRGADVDVVFSEMRNAPDGSVWPTHFLEWVQRPIKIKAHEWRLTRLDIDGTKAF